MRLRVFSALGFASALTLVAVGFLNSTSPQLQFEQDSEAPALPQLADRIDDIEKIIVDQAGGELTIAREGEDWVLSSQDNYSADTAKVKANLLQLAALRLVEPKTREPQLYAKLGVDDPGPDSAASRRLSAFDAAGEEVASIVIGKKRTIIEGKVRPGVYVRREGDPQAWLAAGQIDSSRDLASWTDTFLIGIDAEDIESITVDRVGIGTLHLARIPGDERAYALEGAPDGFSPRPELQLLRVVDQFADIQFDEIRRAEARDAGTITTKLRATDGLELSIEAFKEDDKRWVRIEAIGDGEAATRAEALNQRLGNREFRVSGRHAENIVVSLADLLEPEAES